jgi:hypothetical protein
MSQISSSQGPDDKKPGETDRSARIQVPFIQSNAAGVPVIGDLFTSLTNDLGLGGFPTDFATETSKVEVTQVVRNRVRQKVEQKANELTSLAGPIVDRSRPEQSSGGTGSRPGTVRPSTAYDMVTSPELHHTWDEDEADLLKENPFKISPIDGEMAPIEDTNTVEEPIPSLHSSNILKRDERKITAPQNEEPRQPEIPSADPREQEAYLKRFVRGTPVKARTESASFKDTQVHDTPSPTSRKARSTVMLGLLILVAFGLGMLVASSNEMSNQTPKSEEQSAPSKALKNK